MSGNDLTQQTGSSGQAEPTGGEEEEEDRDRLLLAADGLCASLDSLSTCFRQFSPRGQLIETY